MVFRQGKTPLGSGESTCATTDDVNLRDLSVTVFGLRTRNLARGDIHMFGRADICCIDAVAIGRDPLSRGRVAQRPTCVRQQR